MRWPLILITAILTLNVINATQAQDNANSDWCKAACSAATDATGVPPGCDCDLFIVEDEAGPLGDAKTPLEILLDDIKASYQSEIAQVQNFLLIEKSKAAATPDIRYYERKSPSVAEPEAEPDFVWIPNHELARRETAANPPRDKGTGGDELEYPEELADDPALFFEALGQAAEKLGEFAGTKEQGKAANKAAQSEADNLRVADQESRAGIDTGDPFSNLLEDGIEDLFTEYQRYRLKADADNEEYVFQLGFFYHKEDRFEFYDGDGILEPESLRIVGDETVMDDWVSRRLDRIATDSRLGCLVSLIDPKNKDYGQPSEYWTPSDPFKHYSFLPQDSRIYYGEYWICRVEDWIRPFRVSIDYSSPTTLVPMTLQEENKEYVRRGPVLFSRKIQKRLKEGAKVFVDELEREIRVNLGEPTQADLADVVGETMDWPTFYSKGSP